jgi:hypothetical protein
MRGHLDAQLGAKRHQRCLVGSLRGLSVSKGMCQETKQQETTWSC